MGQDDIISQLVEETFGERPAHARHVDDADIDFNHMTQLSKLPVTSLKAHFIHQNILELRVGLVTLHIPKNHIGQKTTKDLLKILETLVHSKLDACTIVSSEKCVWFIAWDKKEDVRESDIQKIFSPIHHKKAA